MCWASFRLRDSRTGPSNLPALLDSCSHGGAKEEQQSKEEMRPLRKVREGLSEEVIQG
jgi:hypothetical protein